MAKTSPGDADSSDQRQTPLGPIRLSGRQPCITHADPIQKKHSAGFQSLVPQRHVPHYGRVLWSQHHHA